MIRVYDKSNVIVVNLQQKFPEISGYNRYQTKRTINFQDTTQFK